MNVEKALNVAFDLMLNVNEAHNHEIFKDLTLDREELELHFDVLVSQIGYATSIAELLNLTFHIKPSEERVDFYLIP